MDVAFTRGPRGKLIFKRSSDGAIELDRRGVYAVHVAVAAHKDGYYFGSEQYGTQFSAIKKDAAATGSRLTAAALDGIAQAKAEGLIFSGTAAAERLRSGRWRLRIDWQSIDGTQSEVL
jgi:hypothetical protein